jgi:hypothetical protein
MCLSRFMDTVIKTEKYRKGAITKIKIAHTKLGEKDESLLDKRIDHLRGVVPFEILRNEVNFDE